MIPITLALPAFIIGVFFLYKFSDILVDGTAKTSAKLGVSSIVISMIVVAFGTSAPEFAVSVGAAIENQSGISLGNIIGSCIANLLLILGISALIRPIKIQKGIIKREMPMALGATILLLIFSFFGILDTYHWIGGIIFLIIFTAFVVYFIQIAKKEYYTNKETYDVDKLKKNIIFIILGITGVVAGAWLLIESSVAIADFFGIPEFIIALSMVAIGTSLPELVVSATATAKKEADIAVGNVIGSNIFNILLILGAAALFIPLNANSLDSLFYISLLLIASLIMFPIFYTGYIISRKEGVLMLGLYSAYIIYMFFTIHPV